MGPTVAWILAALPKQCAAAVARLTGPVELVLTGPGGGHFVLLPTGRIVSGDDARTETIASISCTTPDLVWVVDRPGVLDGPRGVHRRRPERGWRCCATRSTLFRPSPVATGRAWDTRPRVPSNAWVLHTGL